MINQIVNCPICQNHGSYIEKYDQENSIFANQPIFKCSNCSYSWNNTITQSDLNEYYKFDYNSINFNRKERFEPPSKYFKNENYQFKTTHSKQHLKNCDKIY